LENFLAWLVGAIFITIFLYFWIFKHVKRTKPNVKRKELKFFFLLITTWLFFAIYVIAENNTIQIAVKVVGVIFPMLLYNVFFNWTNNARGDKQ